VLEFHDRSSDKRCLGVAVGFSVTAPNEAKDSSNQMILPMAGRAAYNGRPLRQDPVEHGFVVRLEDSLTDKSLSCVPRWHWRKTMNLNLPAEANEFVKELVAQGKYQNEEAAVVDGVRLLMGREKLRAEIQVGIDQLDRGESCDEETVFAEVDAVIDEVEASGRDE
jgi:putative addiction module CopG family antidote